MKRAVLTILLLSGIWSSVEAAKYYVKPTGSDSNSGLSEALAWQHIMKACTTLVANDTVLIRSGTYDETSWRTGDCWGYSGHQAGMVPKNYGTAGHYIVFKGYPGDTRPVIVGKSPSASISSSGRMGADFVDGTHYIIYDSLEFRKGLTGFHFPGDGADIHDIILRNLIIDSCLGPDLDNNAGGVLIYQDPYHVDHYNGTPVVRNITIENCEIYSNGGWSGSSADYMFGNTSALHLYGCDSCLVQNNIIHDQAAGIHMKHTARFSEVKYNTIYNCGTAMWDRHTGSCVSFGYNGSEKVGTNWHHNIAYHNTTCFALDIGGDPSCAQRDSAIYFWNNTCDCDSANFLTSGNELDCRGGIVSGTGYSQYDFIFNNIIVDVPALVDGGSDSKGGFVWSNSAATPTGIYEDYNLFAGRGDAGQYYDWGGSFYTLTTWKANNVSNLLGGTGNNNPTRGIAGQNGEHDSIGEPSFLSEATRDYHLTSGSPAKTKTGGKGGSFTFWPGTAKATTVTLPTYLGALDPGVVDTAVSISDGSANEGSPITFTVTLATPLAANDSFVVTTSDGTAIAGTNYTAISGTKLGFPADSVSKTFTVTTAHVNTYAADKTFTVTLSGLTYGHFTDATATGTLVEIDPTVAMGSNVAASEGFPIDFIITQSRTLGYANTYTVTTSNGTASSGTNYTAISGTYQIAAGSTSDTVSVTTNNISGYSGNLTFTITISSPTYGTITTASATGTINDLDSPPAVGSGPRVKVRNL
jgi:hypothetical protein